MSPAGIRVLFAGLSLILIAHAPGAIAGAGFAPTICDRSIAGVRPVQVLRVSRFDLEHNTVTLRYEPRFVRGAYAVRAWLSDRFEQENLRILDDAGYASPRRIPPVHRIDLSGLVTSERHFIPVWIGMDRHLGRTAEGVFRFELWVDDALADTVTLPVASALPDPCFVKAEIEIDVFE